MEHVKIVVWDSVGNIMWGVRPWDTWPPPSQERLLAEDPEAQARAPSFDQIFKDYAVDLRIVASVDELVVHIEDADVLVLHKVRVPGEALRAARRLRFIEHLGQDARGVPVEVAREMGIPVAAVPLFNYLVVAEHAWALILNHLKQLPHQREIMGCQSGGWSTVPGIQPARSRTLGLLGLGEIGRAMARVAQAFEMSIVYWDIARFPEIEERYGVHYAEWDDVFRQSDILSVQLALNDATRGIISAREIGLMKPGAFFVNTARGKLVDQEALTDALRARRIGGAGLDVFAEEPLPPGDPLRALHDDLGYNVTLTPHSASLAPWTWVQDSQAVWFNVLRVLRGESARHIVAS